MAMKAKEAIIRLRNNKKAVRDIEQAIGLAKQTVWNIIKKNERSGVCCGMTHHPKSSEAFD